MEEEEKTLPKPQEEFITEERLKKAEAYIEEEEGPSRRLVGRMGIFITVVAVIMSLVHLYAAVGDHHDPDPAGDPCHVRPLPDLPGLPVPEAFSQPDPLV